MNRYWFKHYNDPNIVGNHNSQINVGRTKNGEPISPEVWIRTLNYIEEKLNIAGRRREVLELCCGNGEIIGNLSSQFTKTIGVDYSEILIDQLKKSFPKVETIHENIMNVEFDREQFHAIIFYFAIQHFDERDSLIIIERSLSWLKPGGKMLIGDIPNELRKWKYINKTNYQKDYMARLIEKKPKIGNWFNPGFFKALPAYINGIKVLCIEQPGYQINSFYRFDVIIEKD